MRSHEPRAKLDVPPRSAPRREGERRSRMIRGVRIRWARQQVFSKSTGRTTSICRPPIASSISRIHAAADDKESPTRRRAAWIAAFPIATVVTGTRLPGQQPDPRLERPRLSGQLGRGGAQPALDQQLPRIHRPHLPGALRGSLHPQPRRHAGDDQDDRAPIVDNAWDKGWIKPEIAAEKTGKKVAVIGSGPAGLACAQQLARAGHDVHVYETSPRRAVCCAMAFPTSRWRSHIDRRIAQMEAEGVTFHYGVHVGVTA